MTPEEIQAEMDAAEYELRPIGDLVEWEANPRKGMDLGSKRLARTVSAVGWGADVLVQKSSGRIIGGHLRLMAARRLGLEKVPCKILDVDDQRADELALADNRGSEFAAWDPAALADLLGEMPEDRRAGIGWDEPEFGQLLADLGLDGSLEDPELVPEGTYEETYAVLVKCRDAAHQQEVYDRLLEEGFELKVVVT